MTCGHRLLLMSQFWAGTDVDVAEMDGIGLALRFSVSGFVNDSEFESAAVPDSVARTMHSGRGETIHRLS